MAGFNATDEEKRRMAMKGYSFDEENPYIPGAEGPVKTTYHNPKTGQEFKNLPADSYNLVHYLSRGLQIGPAPVILKEVWENREAREPNATVTGAELPEELKDPTAKLRDEIQELKDMIRGMAKGQTPSPIQEIDVIIEEEKEEEPDIPYDTQLGLII